MVSIYQLKLYYIKINSFICLFLLFEVESKYPKFLDFKNEDMWLHLGNWSRSIEVNYETKDGEEILTKVHFPFNPAVSHITSQSFKAHIDHQLINNIWFHCPLTIKSCTSQTNQIPIPK